ncbi:hypothetical protein Ciccas_009517 [Cichlidogyrus casuarinus]|uniref:Uncharacterized protein n=1 Tax=Cichlidogyrus casuarinus TaxID=1844966 RepID=A0ABD2PX13_9PLAT
MAQMFTKVLQHIDSLLEDWYPDLGCQFRQSTEGTYLITRFIPCTYCMALCPGKMDYLVNQEDNDDSSEEADENLGTVMYFPKGGKIQAGSASLALSSNKIEDLLIFGVTVEEYVHWLLICGESRDKGSRLSCPMHPDVEFKAPDLNFEDLSPNLLPGNENVSLLKFLGRGSFGTVFKGSLLKAQMNQSYEDQNSDVLDGNSMSLHLSDLEREISVAVKIGSPIDPFVARKPVCLAQTNLDGSRPPNASMDGTLKGKEDLMGAPSPWDDDFQALPESEDVGLGDMREAQVFYRQHLKRWNANPVETCFRAYHVSCRRL